MSTEDAASEGRGWGVKQSWGSPQPHVYRAVSLASPGWNSPQAGREKRRASAGFTRIPGAPSNRKKYRSWSPYLSECRDSRTKPARPRAQQSWRAAPAGAVHGTAGLGDVLGSPCCAPHCQAELRSWSKRAFVNPGLRWLLLSCT